MSTERENAIDEHMADLTQENADAAQAWDDEIPPPVVSGDGQILGDGGADIAEILGEIFEELVPPGPAIGPIEFQGHEDYIRGETACLRGVDIVGSVPQFASRAGARMTTRPSVLQGRAQFVKAVSPVHGRIHTAMVIPKTMTRKSDAVTVANARAAAKNALQIAAKLDHAIAAAQYKPATKTVKRSVVGESESLIGSVLSTIKNAFLGTPPRKTRSGHTVPSLAQVKKLAVDLRNAGVKTAAAADTHATVTATAKAKTVAGVKAAAMLLNPKGATGVHGIFGDHHNAPPLDREHFEILGVGNPFEDVIDEAQEAFDIVGAQATFLGDMLHAMVIGAGTPDPTHPGYNTDQSPIPSQPGDTPDGNGWLQPSGALDPAFGDLSYADSAQYGGAGASGGAPGGSTDGAYSTGRYPGPDTNYGMKSAPTMSDAQKAYMDPSAFMSEPPGGEQTQYNAANVDDLKARYTGAIPFTFDLGSSHVPPFKGITSYNTWMPKKDKPYADYSDGNHPNGGFEWHGTDGSRWFVYAPTNVSSLNPPNAQEASNLDVMFDASGAHGWGPLVGNPNNAEYGGLRYAYGSGGAGAPMFFWFRNAAPPWATAQDQLVLYNQMLTDWNTDMTTAKSNYAAQVAQDFADAQTAAQIAKTTQTENAAAAHQADLAAVADQTQQAQLATQQQAQDVAYQGQQDQAQAQQQQLAFQQGQAESQAYADFLKAGGAMQDQGQGQPSGPFDDVEQAPPGFEDAQPMPTEDDAASFEQTADAQNDADASEAELNASASKRPSSDDLDFGEV
ncbi:MAG: hypothetical protein V4550_18450 [Gemmatimonadota bacterium]